MNELNRITGAVVGAALRIHTGLGPGLVESIYETIMARDLNRMGLMVERQRAVSFDFEGLWFDNAFRLDLLVENAVIVEVKSHSSITAAHEKQLLTYLRLLDLRVGLILNFGAPLMKEGIKRVVNAFADSPRGSAAAAPSA
jgi:iron complex transport system substrate-binding protein